MKTPVALVHRNPAHANVAFIDWALGNVCNYACSYCPKHLHDGSVRWPSLGEVLHFSQRVIDHYGSLGKRAFFAFSGGEPTAYKGMLTVLQRLKQLGALTSLISNGSREIPWWDQAMPYLDAVALTFHLEFSDPEHFATLTNRLLGSNLRTHINVTMLLDRFEQCVANAAALASQCPGASVALKPLQHFGTNLPADANNEKAMYSYTAEQKKVMAEFRPRPAKPHPFRGIMRWLYDDGSSEALGPRDLLLREQNRWNGWNCNAGVESLAIKADGQVYRAICRQGGLLGSIFDSSIALPRSPIRCGVEVCPNLNDFRITKWRDDFPLESAHGPRANPQL
jgi:organic radical activating enzyme